MSCVVTDLAPQVLCLLTRIHPDTWLCYWSVELSRKASCSEPGVFKLEALPQEKETTGPMGQCLDATFSQTQEVPGHVAHNEADIRELPESWMVLPAGAQFMTKNTKFNPAVTRTCVLCKMTLKKVGVGQECLSPVSECLGGSSTPPHAVSSLLPCAPGGSR